MMPLYVNPALRMTYREFNEHCRNIAKGLMALGIEKEHVALWATNKPEWVSLQFDGKMGAVLVTVNINYRAAELEYLLKHSDATTIILMEQYRSFLYRHLYELVPELSDSNPKTAITTFSETKM